MEIGKSTRHLYHSDNLDKAADRGWRLQNFPMVVTLGLDNFFPTFPKKVFPGEYLDFWLGKRGKGENIN